MFPLVEDGPKVFAEGLDSEHEGGGELLFRFLLETNSVRVTYPRLSLKPAKNSGEIGQEFGFPSVNDGPGIHKIEGRVVREKKKFLDDYRLVRFVLHIQQETV